MSFRGLKKENSYLKVLFPLYIIEKAPFSMKTSQKRPAEPFQKSVI